MFEISNRQLRSHEVMTLLGILTIIYEFVKRDTKQLCHNYMEYPPIIKEKNMVNQLKINKT